MFKEVYTHLKNNGYDPYSIGQHSGLCNSPYVVIKESMDKGINKGMTLSEVELLVYYPIGAYSECMTYVKELKLAMSKLTLKDNKIPYPIVIDDSKRAYTTVINYTRKRKKV